MSDNRIYNNIARDTIAIGGGTWARDDYKHVTLPNRYTVALGEPWSRLILRDQDDEMMRWAISDNLRELANLTEPWQTTAAFNPNPKALGTWLDPSTGNIHVDIVESLVHRGYALRTARERGQAAIFDQWTWKSVPVPVDTDDIRELDYVGNFQSTK